MAENATTFEESFTLDKINNEKYDRVSRIYGRNADNSVTFQLDIHHDLFPLQVGDSIDVTLATTLALDGTKDEGRGWRDVKHNSETTLADMYEYVCYGKVYKFEESGEGSVIKMYASFGGLLLYIEGPPHKLSSSRVDSIYLLCKKG